MVATATLQVATSTHLKRKLLLIWSMCLIYTLTKCLIGLPGQVLKPVSAA